jgi:hypothetical protein
MSETARQEKGRTPNEMREAGYTFIHARSCSACGTPLEFWRTPKNRLGPFEQTTEGRLISHFATCPKADKFRRKEATK